MKDWLHQKKIRVLEWSSWSLDLSPSPRGVCTSTQSDRYGALIDTYPKGAWISVPGSGTFSWNILRIIPYLLQDNWGSFQLRITATHMISKRTNLSLEQRRGAFACPSRSDISGKQGWLDRRRELDEKSASSKSWTFILQRPGQRKPNLCCR